MDQDPQADGSGYGDPEDDVGFKVRRARIGIAGILDDVPIEGFTKDDVRPSYSVELGYSAPFDGLSTRPGWSCWKPLFQACQTNSC